MSLLAPGSHRDGRSPGTEPGSSSFYGIGILDTCSFFERSLIKCYSVFDFEKSQSGSEERGDGCGEGLEEMP